MKKPKPLRVVKPESARHALAAFAKSGGLRKAVDGLVDANAAALLVRIVSRYCGSTPKGPYRPFGSGIARTAEPKADPTADWPPKGKS